MHTNKSSHKPSTFIGLKSILALLIGLGLYWSIGLFNLRLPGLQYDEAADAIPAMEVLLGQTPSSISSIYIFGRDLPLMMLHHIGPSSIYTSLIGFSLFGISVESLRISQLGVGAITLLLLWHTAYRWFNLRVAGIALLLCATHPAFIWWNRAGANWTAPLLPLALGFVYASWRGWHTAKMRWYLLACFLLGAGITTKILFVWMLAPISITFALLLKRNDVRATLGKTKIIFYVGALLAFVLGLAPLLLHNLRPQSFLQTFKFILGNATETRLYAHNNLDFGNNLVKVTSEFLRMLGGDTLHFGAPAGAPVGAVLFGLCLFGLMAYVWRNKQNNPHHMQHLFLCLCCITVLPVSTVSTSSIGATYLFIIVPFMWLLIAVALDLFIARFLSQKLRVAYSLVALLCFNQVATNVLVHQFFNQTGGRGWWSESIYALNHLLQTRYANRKIMVMDWGFTRSLELLSKKQLTLNEHFGYSLLPNAKFSDLSISLLREPDNIYLFHDARYTAFTQRWQLFQHTAQHMRKKLVLLAVLPERDGTPNTLLYEAQNQPREFNPPSNIQTRNAIFDTAIILLGGEFNFDSSKREVGLRLYWQAQQNNLPDHTILIHVVDESNGQVVFTADQQPLQGNYPFSQWQANEYINDPHWFVLPPEIKPGNYQIRIGIYNANTGQRRAITDPQNDAAGNSLRLQSFQVP